MPRLATLSDLLRTPNEVIKRLDEGDLTITRRGAESLRLSKASRADDGLEALDALSRLIAASLDDDACDRLAQSLGGEHPWMDFLPPQFRRQFVGDYFRTARACAKAGAFQPLMVFVASWESTAEAYARGSIPAGADRAFLGGNERVPDPRTA